MLYALFKSRNISIHSLVKRETFACYSGLSEIPYFNPLPRKEGDSNTARNVQRNENFNPLPRKEGDQPLYRILGELDAISSTPS